MELETLCEQLAKNGFNTSMKNGKVRVKSGLVALPISIEKDLARDTLSVHYNQLVMMFLIFASSILTFMTLEGGSTVSPGLNFGLTMWALVSLLLTESSAKELRQHIRQMKV